MRKPAFYICENKDADQLHGNREADQRLCFRYTDSTIPRLSKSKFHSSSHIQWLHSPFLSDLVGNPEDRFSNNEAHFTYFEHSQSLGFFTIQDLHMFLSGTVSVNYIKLYKTELNNIPIWVYVNENCHDKTWLF